MNHQDLLFIWHHARHYARLWLLPFCAAMFLASLAQANTAPQQQYPARVQDLLNRARAATPQRYQFVLDKGAQIGVTADQQSYYLLWWPPNQASLPAAKRTLIVTLHGSDGWAFDDLFLWYEMALKHGHGLLALQWFLPGNPPPQDYYAPNQVYAALAPILQEQGIQPGRALSHGFSRASANGYYVTMFDRLSGNHFFGLNIASSGGASTGYPFYLEVNSGKYGPRPLAGTRWITASGGRDPNPDRDGIPALRRTGQWLVEQGAMLDLVIEDSAGGHGVFMINQRYVDHALTYFENLLAAASPVWQVKPDNSFRIANASIPNVGLVNNEVWLTVGGAGGIRLLRSPEGGNMNAPSTIPGLTTALNGTGFNVTETIPRTAADGTPELYVLGLGAPGTNSSAIFRLRADANGNFQRNPQAPVFSGAAADNQFLGVPDVYATNDGQLRLMYVARGATRQNSRTAVSANQGQSFTFEYENAFNDLNVSAPSAENTNVDPAVLKLAQGGYLAVTMRAKRLYLFSSTDGRVFTPLLQGAIEAGKYWPNATGFFDPTLLQLPDGRVYVYVTLEELGGLNSVVRALLEPAQLATAVNAANYRATALAPASITALFGNSLANGTQAATVTPLPMNLAGSTVTLRDSVGNEANAPLFFAAPNQINFAMPSNLATGLATLTMQNNLQPLSATTINLVPTAPGLFSADASGQGLAAGVALRVKADQSQSYEPIVRFDAALNRYVAIPINLSNANEQVFLILFGTGIRGRSATAGVSASIGGVTHAVLFADAQGEFSGLDQVNLRLLNELNGRGEVEVQLNVDGQTSNTVKIQIAK